MIGTPRMLDDSALPYVTTLHQDLQRLMNGYADVGTKDDGAGSNETFIVMVIDGNVQGVSVFLETPHLHDDALSVTSDGYDCIMLAVLMGDVELLDVILRAISRAHSSMSRDSPELAKLYADAVHGSNVNMRHFPPPPPPAPARQHRRAVSTSHSSCVAGCGVCAAAAALRSTPCDLW